MQLMSQELDRVLQEILSPRSYDAHCALVEEFRERFDRGGPERARLWLEARDFKAGRSVKLPPSGWDWVQYVQAREPVPETIRAQLRSFWAWYVPLEVRSIQLIRLLTLAHELCEDEVKTRLYGIAVSVHGQLVDWREDGRILWLPKDRGNGWRGGSLIEVLSQGITHFDDAPARERGVMEPWP